MTAISPNPIHHWTWIHLKPRVGSSQRFSGRLSLPYHFLGGVEGFSFGGDWISICFVGTGVGLTFGPT